MTLSTTLNCIECGEETLRTSNCQKTCPNCRKSRNKRKHSEARIARGYRNGKGRAGKHNGGWKGGISSKYGKNHFKRDRCERCYSINKLELHHKDRDKTNNTKENLETLCESCHKKEHQNEIIICKDCGTETRGTKKRERCDPCGRAHKLEYAKEYYRRKKKVKSTHLQSFAKGF